MIRLCHNCGRDTRVKPKTHPKAVVLCLRCNTQHYGTDKPETAKEAGEWDNAVKIVEEKR